MLDIPALTTISAIAGQTQLWFVDIWGVIHNGVKPYAQAISACTRFRDSGGCIILVSNSPRPRSGVIQQLDQIGVDRRSYDDCITSGDVSRTLISEFQGRPVFHLGPPRDLAIFDGLSVMRGTEQATEVIVCTGLFDDERETPDTYAAMLQSFRARNIPMICANPDKTVLRGGRLIFCAGAIAAAYQALGGSVQFAGKPFSPIYEAAFSKARELMGEPVAKSSVLAIGDGVATDIAGAIAADIQSVFIAGGLHVADHEDIAEAATELCRDLVRKPVGVMRELAW